jgi:hypothetical protein
MLSHAAMKLGKLAPRVDHRTLRMARYIAFEALPPPPVTVDYTKGITSFGMMLNDTLGICTEAAKGHAVQIWTANLGTEITVPDAVVLDAYEKECGYNPADSSTDQGGDEITVLNSWRNNGFGGHELLGYADPNPNDILHVKQSIYLFGGVYIGLALPLTAQTQDIWDVELDNRSWFAKMLKKSDPTEPNSWGGHAVFCPAYNNIGPICITWGQLKQMTWAFWLKYCDESHTLFSKDWIGAKNPVGFAQPIFQQDLLDIAA